MEAIKEWAFSICAAAIAGAAVELISPSGNIKKMVKITVSVFFLTCMLSPMIDLGIDAFYGYGEYEPAPETEHFETQVEDEMLKIFTQNIQEKVNNALEECKIKDAKIKTKINIGEDFSISISEIKISLGKEYAEKEGEVTDLLCERFGAKVNITFKEQ